MVFDNGKFLDGYLPLVGQLYHLRFKRLVAEGETGYLNYRNEGVPNESYSDIQSGYLLVGPSFYPVLFGNNEGVMVSASAGLSREVVDYHYLPDPGQSFKRGGWTGIYFYGVGVQKWLGKKIVIQGKLGVAGDFNGGGNVLGGFAEGKIVIGFKLK